MFECGSVLQLEVGTDADLFWAVCRQGSQHPYLLWGDAQSISGQRKQ
jgi:hypothetical protein